PQAKLHIRADEEEHATLRLEATGSNKHSRLYFSDDIYLTASPQNNLSFTLPENNNLIFENGKVGIGTNDPQARLQVVGSMIAGGNNIASGANAIAIGTNTTASGYSSFASGNLSIASGEVSTAIGGNVTSSAPSAITIGRFLNASGSRSMVLGSGKDNTLRLTNGIPHTLMIGFSSDKPTIFVSETPYGYQTGKIGIGNVTDPQAKLHIRADENEHATLRLEATGSDKHSSIAFSGEHFIIAKENDHLSFNTSQDKTFLFHNGDIFIEDITKGIIMKSPNGQCWRGVLSDNGQLVFSVVTCPDGSANVPEPSIEPALQMKIYPNPTDGTITIEVPDGVNNADWSLRSTDGALLMRNRITSGKTEISLTNFVAGVYVISIEQNGRLIASEKVVKQ
ncbi:MAG: T9SS type A sorting domain-containing protein, partial [Bacteroidales bacterium]|nr:T9SS type A sorting domain-containing protein [Bacteroidales bacterium]